MKVSVSFLNVKKKYIERVIEELDKTSADFIHVDVKDGKYVKGKANLFKSIKDIGYLTRKRLDIHFMVRKPLKMIDNYALLKYMESTQNAINTTNQNLDRQPFIQINNQKVCQSFRYIKIISSYYISSFIKALIPYSITSFFSSGLKLLCKTVLINSPFREISFS